MEITAAGEASLACAAIEGNDAAVTPPLLFAVRAKFLGRDFDFDDDRGALPLRSQLASLADAQPHVVVARERGRSVLAVSWEAAMKAEQWSGCPTAVQFVVDGQLLIVPGLRCG